MSILGWLKGTPHTVPGRDSAARAGGAAAVAGNHGEPKTGTSRNTESASDVAVRRKSERARLRELLYNVVRESMIRVGVLSSSFKFKVLATDPRGRKFIVMMDLSREFDCEISRLAEIEALICQSAKSRHNIVVSTVYWRAEEAAVERRTHGAHAADIEHRATIPAADNGAVGKSQALPDAKSKSDPILADEIAALKRALGRGAAVAAAATHASGHPATLTGFENTEIIDSVMPEAEGSETGHPESEIAETQMLDDEPDHPALSPTQYGDLR